jgi:hypothetical protein
VRGLGRLNRLSLTASRAVYQDVSRLMSLWTSPLHDEVTLLMLPSRRIIFVSYWTAQNITSTAYAQDQRSELGVFTRFDAQENGFGSLY